MANLVACSMPDDRNNNPVICDYSKQQFHVQQSLDSGFESIDQIDLDMPSLNSVNQYNGQEQIDSDLRKLEDSYRRMKIAASMFLQNKFDETIEYLDGDAKTDLCSSHVTAIIHFFLALLTKENEDVQKAKKWLKSDLELISKKRKQKSLTSNLTGFLWKEDYNSYTEEEAICEAHYAESLVMISLITFFCNGNVVGALVKGAVRLATANSTINLTVEIFKHKNNWKSELLKSCFENNVRLIAGASNLIISHLPSRVVKLMTIVGIHGKRSVAYDYLTALTTNKDDVRYEVCAIIIIGYNVYIEQMLGISEGDLKWSQELAEDLVQKHPNGLITEWFLAKVRQSQGHTHEAIKSYQRILEFKTNWLSIHQIIYWDLLWSYSLLGEWTSAVKYAKQMQLCSKWSPATNLYNWAAFLFHANNMSLENVEVKGQLEEALRQVPELRMRIVGKTISAERFIIEKSQKFFEERPEDVFLVPAYEQFYAWNVIPLAAGKEDILRPILNDIEGHLERLDALSLNNDTCLGEKQNENRCLLLLLRGVCMKYLNVKVAISCFRDIIESENDLPRHCYLVPHATLELGLSYLRLEQFEEAKHWVQNAQNDFKFRYQMENLVSLRAHSAMRLIKIGLKQNAGRDV